jgi:hypothetical protein
MCTAQFASLCPISITSTASTTPLGYVYPHGHMYTCMAHDAGFILITARRHSMRSIRHISRLWMLLRLMQDTFR